MVFNCFSCIHCHNTGLDKNGSKPCFFCNGNSRVRADIISNKLSILKESIFISRNVQDVRIPQTLHSEI